MYDLHSVQTRSSSVTPCTAIVSSCFIAVLLDVRKLHYFDSLSTCCTTCCTTSCTIRIHQKSAASNKCTTSWHVDMRMQLTTCTTGQIRSGLHRPAAFSHWCHCYQLPPLFCVLCSVTQCHSLSSWCFSEFKHTGSSAQSRSELSLATCSGPRTMEATCGNGYAPVRGMPALMMMNSSKVFNKGHPSFDWWSFATWLPLLNSSSSATVVSAYRWQDSLQVTLGADNSSACAQECHFDSMVQRLATTRRCDLGCVHTNKGKSPTARMPVFQITVATSCYISDVPCQCEGQNFDPTQLPHFPTDLSETQNEKKDIRETTKHAKLGWRRAKERGLRK